MTEFIDELELEISENPVEIAFSLEILLGVFNLLLVAYQPSDFDDKFKIEKGVFVDGSFGVVQETSA